MKYLPLNVKPHAANQSRVTKETHLCIHYFVYMLGIDTVHRLSVLLCTGIILVEHFAPLPTVTLCSKTSKFYISQIQLSDVPVESRMLIGRQTPFRNQ